MKSKGKARQSEPKVKVQDLKSKKDPKGGLPLEPCSPRGQSSPRSLLPAIQ
jgi:hypothetical protein